MPWKNILLVQIGNCDNDFLNFHHCQVWNFKILNQYEQNRNLRVIFQKYQKQKRKSTKYFKTSQKPSVIRLKFCEMSLVSWNLINYCKILQFLIKLCKSPKDLRKILQKWLGKTVKYCLNFVNFHSLKNGFKLANFCLKLTKVFDIPQRFSQSQTFSFNKILSHFISFMTEIFLFTKISQLPRYKHSSLLCCNVTDKEEKVL